MRGSQIVDRGLIFILYFDAHETVLLPRVFLDSVLNYRSAHAKLGAVNSGWPLLCFCGVKILFSFSNSGDFDQSHGGTPASTAERTAALNQFPRQPPEPSPYCSNNELCTTWSQPTSWSPFLQTIGSTEPESIRELIISRSADKT